MLGLGIDDLERPRDGEAQAASNRKLIAKRNIAARLWNGVVQNTLKAHVDVQLPQGLNALLKSVGNRKIPQFYRDSSIGLCRVLSEQELSLSEGPSQPWLWLRRLRG